MHAVRLHAFGPPEALRYEALPDLTPAAGQVRLAVQAAGILFIDTAVRAGVQMGHAALPALPSVMGREAAGVVDAVGDGVGEEWLGRRVVAYLGPEGGYAEQVVVAADALHALPDEVAFDAAVAMIATGRTALAVLDLAGLHAGDVVLISGAAGGLGTLMAQGARHAGATVVGLAHGPDKLARVRADVAVDYGEDRWPERVREVLGGRAPTVALDGAGGDTGRAMFDLLADGGRHVIIGWAAGAPTAFTTADVMARRLTVNASLGPHMGAWPGGLRDLETRALAEAAAGRLTPAVDRFALADAAGAHAALQERRTTGKVVLVPGHA